MGGRRAAARSGAALRCLAALLAAPAHHLGCRGMQGACEAAAGSDWHLATRHRRVHAFPIACLNSEYANSNCSAFKGLQGRLSRCCTTYSRTHLQELTGRESTSNNVQ